MNQWKQSFSRDNSRMTTSDLHKLTHRCKCVPAKTHRREEGRGERRLGQVALNKVVIIYGVPSIARWSMFPLLRLFYRRNRPEPSPWNHGSISLCFASEAICVTSYNRKIPWFKSLVIQLVSLAIGLPAERNIFVHWGVDFSSVNNNKKNNWSNLLIYLCNWDKSYLSV